MTTNKDKSILKGATPCPFCKAKPRAMTMKGYLGFCCYVGCENKKCLVNPRTGMVEAKTESAVKKKAIVAWENRKKK